MFAHQTTTLNTTAGLLTQTLRFPRLLIESPHCLIGTRMIPQPDSKHPRKLVGTSAPPFKNKNYIINCVKRRLVFCWRLRNACTQGLLGSRAIRTPLVSHEASLLAGAERLKLDYLVPCKSPKYLHYRDPFSKMFSLTYILLPEMP